MKSFFRDPSIMAWALLLATSLLFLGPAWADDSASTVEGRSVCEDTLRGEAIIDPALDPPFFRTIETSLPEHIVEQPDGSIEDTVDGSIDPDDLCRIEHSARCLSSHQGEHMMSFCEALPGSRGLELTIRGGLPAYASRFIVTSEQDRRFGCRFEAVHPASAPSLFFPTA